MVVCLSPCFGALVSQTHEARIKSAYAHMMSRQRADSVFIFLQQDVSEKRFHNKAIEFFMEIGLTQFKNKLRGTSKAAT